jgi:hypothetical protein
MRVSKKSAWRILLDFLADHPILTSLADESASQLSLLRDYIVYTYTNTLNLHKGKRVSCLFSLEICSILEFWFWKCLSCLPFKVVIDHQNLWTHNIEAWYFDALPWYMYMMHLPGFIRVTVSTFLVELILGHKNKKKRKYYH